MSTDSLQRKSAEYISGSCTAAIVCGYRYHLLACGPLVPRFFLHLQKQVEGWDGSGAGLTVNCTGLRLCPFQISNVSSRRSRALVLVPQLQNLRPGASSPRCLSAVSPALRCGSPCHPPVRQADTHATSPAQELQCCGQDNSPLSPQVLAVQDRGIRPGEPGCAIQDHP